MRPECAAIDCIYRNKPMTLRDRLYVAVTKELLHKHPEQPFDDNFLTFLDTHMDEQVDILHKHMFGEFLQQNRHTMSEHSVLYVPVPGEQEPIVHLTHEAVIRYAQWLAENDLLPEDKKRRVQVLLTTKDAQDVQDLMDFYAMLEGDLKI